MRSCSKLLILLIFPAVIFAFSCGQNKETIQSSAPAKPAEMQVYKSVGVIKNIDADAGKVTINHEDIPGYMPAMEMTQTVRDAKMLESLKAGDQVDFEIERGGSSLVITKLNKTGEVAVINGGEIYKMSCAECHGGVGEGAEKGISLLKGHALKHSEKEYIEQVIDGDGEKMPAFKDKLSPEQIAAVVKYIREELQKDIPKESSEHLH